MRVLFALPLNAHTHIMSHARRSPPQNEVAARAAQLSALTRRRDALLARAARDERNAAKLAGAAAKQRALGDVGDTTLKAMSTCICTVEKARVELGQQVRWRRIDQPPDRHHAAIIHSNSSGILIKSLNSENLNSRGD